MNRLIRDGVPSIVNPFDGYALEMAARIKDQRDDVQIVVMSMGPMQAKDALKTCLAVDDILKTLLETQFKLKNRGFL